MREFRVTDDIFTGPATDESFEEFDSSFVDDEDRKHDEPDAIDRYIARLAHDEAVREAA